MSLAKVQGILKKLLWNKGVKDPERRSVRKVLQILGNPHQDLKYIHITGTNGKGSAAVKTASVLMEAGFKVGLFTSPHLYTFRERVQINGQMIQMETLSNYLAFVEQLFQKQQLNETIFAYFLIVALLHYRDQKCDYVVLEAGIGARTDTTCFVTPQVSVLTTIGQDHVQQIGPTLDDIAYQKAGIIKEGVPVVLGPKAQHELVFKEAEKLKSQICVVEGEFKNYEEENQAIARKVIEVLKKTSTKLDCITEAHIQTGIQKRPPCRMQELLPHLLPKEVQGKRVFFDGGHNPQALTKIVDFIDTQKWNKEQICIVYGSASHRKPKEPLSILSGITNQIFLVSPHTMRAHRISDIKSSVGSLEQSDKFKVIEEGDIKKTLDVVMVDSSYKYIIVCGSFLVMPEARGYFEPELLKINQIETIQGPPSTIC